MYFDILLVCFKKVFFVIDIYQYDVNVISYTWLVEICVEGTFGIRIILLRWYKYLLSRFVGSKVLQRSTDTV